VTLDINNAYEREIVVFSVLKMETKHTGRMPKQEFDRLTDEIRAIVGSRLKNHKDGDSEQALFSMN